MKLSVVFALATLVATISALGDVVGVDNTNANVEHVAENVLNNLDAHNLAKNANADVLSHIASVGGDSHEDGNDDYEGAEEGSDNEEDGEEEEEEEGADEEAKDEDDDQEDDE